MANAIRRGVNAGLVGLSASAIVFTAVVEPKPEPAPTRAVAVSCAEIELTAASVPLPPGLSSLSPAQVLTIGQALSTVVVNPTLVPTSGLINLANFIDSAYLAIEPWVRYAFEVAAYVVSWIPYIGWIIDDQIYVVYNFVEALIHSGVFNVTDWMRGEGSFAKNFADWVADLGLSLAWLAIDEIGAWVPLPPINYPDYRAPYYDLPEGFFGDILVETSNALAQISNRIWDIWVPIMNGVDSGVAWLSGILDQFAGIPFVPLINFELNEAWKLIATGEEQLIGFAHDMINAGDQFIFDTIEGAGLVAATVTAFNTTVASISARLGASAQAFIDWGRAQIDYLVDLVTPGTASVPVTAQRTTEEDAQATGDGAAGAVAAITKEIPVAVTAGASTEPDSAEPDSTDDPESVARVGAPSAPVLDVDVALTDDNPAVAVAPVERDVPTAPTAEPAVEASGVDGRITPRKPHLGIRGTTKATVRQHSVRSTTKPADRDTADGKPGSEADRSGASVDKTSDATSVKSPSKADRSTGRLTTARPR